MSICIEFADECLDRDVTRPRHSTDFSLLCCSAGKLPAFHRTDKIAPCHGLTGSWKLPTALDRDSSTLFPRVGEGWGPHEFLAPALEMYWPCQHGQNAGGDPCYSGVGGMISSGRVSPGCQGDMSWTVLT